MKFKPMQDRILVKPMANVSSGGVVLPETSQEAPKWAVVLAVGDGSRFQSGLTIPVKVHEGQRVMYERNAGVPIMVDTENLLMLREGDVIGYFEDDVEPSQKLSVVN